MLMSLWPRFLAHPVSRMFTFHSATVKNSRNCDIAATVRPISIKFGTVMQNASVKCTAVKIFNFKNPSWWTNAIFKIKNDAELVSQAILNFKT